MDYSHELKNLGSEIRRRRISAGLSQEHFAATAGLHRTYVSGIERGERNPTAEIIFRIASALDCNPAELFSEAE